MIFKKYEFDSETIAQQRIAALLDEEGYTKHVVVELGYLWITEPTYDEEGNELTAGVKSDRYSVDVLWHDQEEDWSDVEIQYDESWISNNGAHTFYGYTFYEPV